MTSLYLAGDMKSIGGRARGWEKVKKGEGNLWDCIKSKMERYILLLH